MEKQTLPPAGSKMFQVHEEDLAQLESDLPQILGIASMHDMSHGERVMWRRVIETIKNIRWNYGPHLHTEEPPQ